MNKVQNHTITTILLSCSMLLSLAQNGVLDTAFGEGGHVTQNRHPFEDILALSIKVAPDDKLVTGGHYYGSFFSFYAFLARYHANGSLDSSFGVNGIANPTQRADWSIIDIVIQPDGKILAAGIVGKYNFAVFRFSNTGVIDSSFGQFGVFHPNPIWHLGNGQALQVKVQPDGKILACGEYNYGSPAVIYRLFSDGTADTTFGNHGEATLTYNGYNTTVSSFIILSDGSIVLGGQIEVNSINYQALFKIDATGALDYSFGDKGVSFDVNSPNDFGGKILEDNNGKFMIIGETNSGFSTITRYLPNGNIDSLFGSNGSVEYDVPGLNSISIFDFELLDDGSIMAVGKADSAGERHFALRTLTNGIQDISFNNGRGYFLSTDTLLGAYYGIGKVNNSTFVATGKKSIGLTSAVLLSKFKYVNGIGITQENQLQSPFRIYPNPTQGSIDIKSPIEQVFTLYNLQGVQLWRTARKEKTIQADFGHLPVGIYLLQAESGATQRIVISK